MLCQSCSKNMATTHIKTIVNGEFKEYILCKECAQKLGYMNMFDSFVSDFSNLWGSFLGDNFKNNMLPDKKRCEFCGSSFEDIVSTGKVGCANCYKVFYDEIMPSIQRMHGNTSHKGRKSSTNSIKNNIVNEVDDLKVKLSKAIEMEEFEEAARLRDQIRNIEGKVKNND